MDADDRKILENEVARSIGKAVSTWLKKNGIEDSVTVTAAVMRPTLYVDELGVSHNGIVTIIDVDIHDDDDEEDDY